MAKNKYKQITFAEGYNKPFAEFKKEFEKTHVFKAMKPKIRDRELKKAHKIAINGNELPRSKSKSKEAKSEQDKE